MCGRYTLVQWEELAARFGVTLSGPLTARYNIAPTQQVPVVLQEAGYNKLVLLRWGLIPHWSRDPSAGYRLINARAETVAEKNSFRESFLHRRCLVPADGFYEWRKDGGGKRPYRFTVRSGELFSFAGLWDVWKPPAGEPVYSFTIITTQANPLVASVHDRMPVILDRAGESVWLNPTAGKNLLLPLLVPYAPLDMLRHEVSELVNSPKNDVPEVLLPGTL